MKVSFECDKHVENHTYLHKYTYMFRRISLYRLCESISVFHRLNVRLLHIFIIFIVVSDCVSHINAILMDETKQNKTIPEKSTNIRKKCDRERIKEKWIDNDIDI